MKAILALTLLALSACDYEPYPKDNCTTTCLKREMIDVQTCGKSGGGTAGGAVTGFFLGGPVGALIGAGAGHTMSDTRCVNKKEMQCTSEETKCTPNPEWVAWKARQK